MEATEPTLTAWFAGRIPDDWFTDPITVTTDREEILVTGSLAEPAVPTDDTPAAGTDPEERPGEEARAVACSSRIEAFREDTRDRRIRIAGEAERRFGRKVSWAARCGPVETLFTSASVPVMTRLRMPERSVLDTLIDAGVARSRSDALAWCVRLVGQHQEEWIARLREALTAVHDARAAGPTT
jgi:hypothetical protein